MVTLGLLFLENHSKIAWTQLLVSQIVKEEAFCKYFHCVLDLLHLWIRHLIQMRQKEYLQEQLKYQNRDWFPFCLQEYYTVMQLIYQRVVQKLKKDSFERYEQRKKAYKLNNNLSTEELPPQRKQNKSLIKTQQPVQNYLDNRLNKPKDNSYKSINKSQQRSQNHNNLKAPSLKRNDPQNEFKVQPLKINRQSSYQQPIRPIKPSHPQPTQYPDEHQQIKLIPCPDCGRKFKPDSLAKHTKNCKKIFGTQIQAMDFSKKREIEGMSQISKSSQPVRSKKRVDYKSESLRLQAMMRLGKNQELTAEQQEAMKQEDSREECKNCSRKFAPERIQKHYEICINNKKKK